jgi:NAD-dependent SIR2 family protein deacetylase
VVYPAASIPITAKERGAIVIEINKESTPMTDQISDYLICGSAGEIIPAIVEEVKKGISPHPRPLPSWERARVRGKRQEYCNL